jgi:hypothetical protein
MAGVEIDFGGWAGWHLPGPVAITLNNVSLELSIPQDRRVSGRASGLLSIGSGSQTGVVELLLALPYDPSAFRLTYEPSGNEIPTLEALVTFVSGDWSLPGPVADFARAIEIRKFEVAIGQLSGVYLEIRAFTGRTWPLVPGDGRFDLTAIYLILSKATGTGLTGLLHATLLIGAGRLPMVVGMRRSWTDFTIAVDRSQPVTMPTVGDLANLVSQGWGGDLPPEVAAVGSGADLKEFKFEKIANAWTLTIAIDARPGWSWQPIGDFGGLTLANLRLRFTKPASGQAAGSGDLTAVVAGKPVDFRLIVPQPRITGTIAAGELNLGVIVGYILNQTAPDWLSQVGLQQLTLTLTWGSAASLTFAALLASDVTLPDKSKLVKVVVEGIISRGRRSVCLTADWVPADGGNGINGSICYPFNRFCTSGGKCFDFPPKSTPPSPDPPNPPTYPTVYQLVGALLVGGAGIAAIAVACAIYGASAAETAAAILALETAAADLLALSNAIRQAYEYNQRSLLFMRNMLQAIEQIKPALRPTLPRAGEMLHAAPFEVVESAPTLQTLYQPSPSDLVTTLQNAWQGKVSAPTMTRALAVSSYEPVSCAAPIQNMFRIGTGPDFVGLFGGAGFSPPISAPTYARILREASFDAVQAVAGLLRAAPGIFAADVIRYLATAGYPAPQVALAVKTSSLGPQVATAAQMTSFLMAAYAGLSFGDVMAALAACQYLVYEAMGAALPGYRQVPAAELARGIMAAYPGIGPLTFAVGCGNSAVLSQATIGALLGLAFSPLRPEATLPLASGVAMANFTQVVTLCALRRSQGVPIGPTASQLQSNWPTLSLYALTGVLATVYSPTLTDLAFAATAASPNYSTTAGQASLLLSDPNRIEPATLATTYLQALENSNHTALPLGLAGGLAGAYNSVSRPLDATTEMQALYAAYGQNLKRADAARAVHLTLNATALEGVRALVATFTSPPVVPGQCAAAIASGYEYPAQLPADLAAALISAFSLGQCPQAVGAISVALAQGQFTEASVTSALPGLMTGWQGQYAATVHDVYTQDIWGTAYIQWIQQGQNTQQVATVLQQTYHPTADRLVEVLAGACALVFHSTAATPLAQGLKVASFTLKVALGSLIDFFIPLWTSDDSDQVFRVYNQRL